MSFRLPTKADSFRLALVYEPAYVGYGAIEDVSHKPVLKTVYLKHLAVNLRPGCPFLQCSRFSGRLRGLFSLAGIFPCKSEKLPLRPWKRARRPKFWMVGLVLSCVAETFAVL